MASLGLQQTTEKSFRKEALAQGSIHLLVSGTLNNLATFNSGAWTWPNEDNPAIWKKNSVDTVPENWTASASPLTGAYLKGITVSVLPSGSEATSATEALKICTRLGMDLQVGSGSTERLVLDIISKQIEDGYIYFEVDQALETPISSVPTYFLYSGNNYTGYVYNNTGETLTVSLYPYTPPVESEEYNPIYNNVNNNRVGTIARNVEVFEIKNLLIGNISGANAIYDGVDSDWSSSGLNPEYILNIDGMNNASWSLNPDPNIIANAGNVAGIYRYIPLISLDKVTGMASIPDSFYTSIANISGRFLGTKNAEYHTYTGQKQVFTNKNIAECLADVRENVEKDILLVYEGSPLVLDTTETKWPITAESVTGNLTGKVNLGRFSGSFDGTINGTLNGFVSNLDIEEENLTYYSSSNNSAEYVVGLQHPTFSNASASIRGIGDLESKDTIVLTGSVRIESNQDVSGTLQGSPNISLLEGQTSTVKQVYNPSLFYMKNVDLTDGNLSIGNIGSGTLQIVAETNGTVGCTSVGRDILFITGSTSATISGTLGGNVTNVNLHLFNGTCTFLNGKNQQVEFDHADSEGVSLTNVSTVEQTTTSLIGTFNGGFYGLQGKAGFDFTEGDLEMSFVNGYGSIITEDLSSGSTLSGSDNFMSASGAEKYAPGWNITTVKADILGSADQPLQPGTGLLAGSFKDFTVKGLRKVLKASFKYRQPTGTAIPQGDIYGITQLIEDLKAGEVFAVSALDRMFSDQTGSAELNPLQITEAQLPDRAYEAMTVATSYTVNVSESNWVPLWSGSTGLVDPNLNFYDPDNESEVIAFISGSRRTIASASQFLSGSLVDSLYWAEAGYPVYVYLESDGTDYLVATLNDFSGTCITLDNRTVSGSYQSGSFKRIWGRFSEGVVSKGSMLSKLQVLGTEARITSLERAFPLAASKQRETNTDAGGSINGVIYGAFGYEGYLNGSCEGNLIKGTLEGEMAGNIAGIFETGVVEEGSVRVSGVSTGKLSGSIKAGQLKGLIRNLKVQGNNLNSNIELSGSLTGTETLPLIGTVGGHAKSLILPEQCNYALKVAGEGIEPFSMHIPAGNEVQGILQQRILQSGSTFLPLPGTLYRTGLKGQFELMTDMSGSTILLDTRSGSQDPFTGQVSTIPVSQSVSGSFDVNLLRNTYIGLQLSAGTITDFTGHALFQGAINLKTGSTGNLVEGHDRPFLTMQSFSGSIFSEDTTVEAVQNMDLSDMVFENLGFTSGMALVEYSQVTVNAAGTLKKVKEQEFVQNTLTLPRIGDILYTQPGGKTRVVSSKVYCPELNALLTINDRGTVVSQLLLEQIQ